jgi:hypothetical protein
MTLAVTLRVMASTVGVAEESPVIHKAIDAYLERWSALAPLADLRRGAQLGRALGGASRALTWHAVTLDAPATTHRLPRRRRRVAQGYGPSARLASSLCRSCPSSRRSSSPSASR